MPIIISQSGKNAIRLEPTRFAQEADLQQYIEDNPEAIPLDDIKEEAQFLILDREFPVGVGSIDALGVDSDGDIYIIETKLYKNSDKRRVIAQVLDYGAALWSRNENPELWIQNLERRLEAKGVNLNDLLVAEFGESEDVTQNMVQNFARGSFRFIVLMDQVPPALKDLILYINQNSIFTVYGVELEYYEHGDMNILKPQLFGAETRRKSVTSTGSACKKWDETSFFEEAETQLNEVELKAVRRLYDFCVEIADEVYWGTGEVKGSFNPRIESIGSKSLLSVYSDGRLRFRYETIEGNEAIERWKQILSQKLRTLQPIKDVFIDRRTEVAMIPPGTWTLFVDEIIEIVRDSLAEINFYDEGPG